MARVTVEDCIDKVDNRFDLVLLAAHRARMISSGSQLTVDRDNDKNPVVSLREIAEQTISPEDLREELVHSLQKFVEVDEPVIGRAAALARCHELPRQPQVALNEVGGDAPVAETGQVTHRLERALHVIYIYKTNT